MVSMDEGELLVVVIVIASPPPLVSNLLHKIFKLTKTSNGQNIRNPTGQIVFFYFISSHSFPGAGRVCLLRLDLNKPSWVCKQTFTGLYK